MRALAPCRVVFLCFVFVVYFSSFIVKKGNKWLMSSTDTLPYIISSLLMDQSFSTSQKAHFYKQSFSLNNTEQILTGVTLGFLLN